jgi:uncharacterized protein
MSQENVEAFKRAVEALNRRDIEAVLEEVDPEVQAHNAGEMSLGAGATRGHEGLRETFRTWSEAFAEFHYAFPEISDLGDRVIAIGQLRARGRESGAELESPIAYVAEFKDGKAIRIWSYLDPKEALQAAGLSE